MKKWNFQKPLSAFLILGGSLAVPFYLNAFYAEECPVYGYEVCPPQGFDYEDPRRPQDDCPSNCPTYPYHIRSAPNEYPCNPNPKNLEGCPEVYGAPTNDYSDPNCECFYPPRNDLPAYGYPHYPTANENDPRVENSASQYLGYPDLEREYPVDNLDFPVFNEYPYEEENRYHYPMEDAICENKVEAAQLCLPPCAPCNPYCLEIGADFIYWKPLVDDLDYAFKSNGPLTDLINEEATGEGKFKYLHFDWEPGYRIFVKAPSLLWKCWSLSSSFTYLRPVARNSTDVLDDDEALDMLLPTALHGGYNTIVDLDAASGKWDLKYKDFDFLFSFDFTSEDCHIFSPFIGVEILRLDHDVHFNYNSTTSLGYGSVRWDGDFFGAGLKAGASYHFDLAKSFYLNAKASASILNGNADYSYRQRRRVTGIDPEETNFRLDSDESIFVPGFQLSIGLGYNGCLVRFPMKVEIGYEFVEWSNTPNPKKFWDSFVLLGVGGPSSLTTIGFHGFKAGLTLSF